MRKTFRLVSLILCRFSVDYSIDFFCFCPNNHSIVIDFVSVTLWTALTKSTLFFIGRCIKLRTGTFFWACEEIASISMQVFVVRVVQDNILDVCCKLLISKSDHATSGMLSLSPFSHLSHFV